MKRNMAAAALAALAASSAPAHDGRSHPPGETHDTPPAAGPPAAPSDRARVPGGHAHQSPHGGIVATIDEDTHIEVVFAARAFAVYFYDTTMKPIALPTDAKATVVVDKGVKKLDLPIAKKADGTPDDHVVGELAVAPDQKAAVVIQATLLGKARTARVEKAAAVAAAKPAAPAVPSAPTGAP